MWEQQPEIEEWELVVARGSVRRFLREFRGLRGLEERDLIQRCLIHWCVQRSRYDPSHRASARTFMNRTMWNFLLDVARRASARKRKAEQTMVSLDEPVSQEAEESDELTLGGVMPDKASAVRMAGLPLQVDLRTVLTRLTPQQQALCQLLTEGETVTAISRKLRVPRATLYDEIKRIRRMFYSTGLREYVD